MGATFLAPAAPPAPPVAPTGGEETIEKDINFTKKIEFWKFFWFFWMIYEEIEHILYYEISLLINLLLKHLLKSQFWIFLWFFWPDHLRPRPLGGVLVKYSKINVNISIFAPTSHWEGGIYLVAFKFKWWKCIRKLLNHTDRNSIRGAKWRSVMFPIKA